ncbi:hypothetical protein BJF85_00430 [Saccharomonospora sp. CUA-673]|uniref:hypothetical protein n=1 Tax=Saccharomonospora sp. CUA-673 TaxID=1904969 RepID=UPI00095E54ED|nr:hypothetical protein [Saccharomonospora sp. CUA-673]OLT46964.1 hypothetical protein BJF85_00430 [Saccharomonospora sp. CUA-673]
MRIALGVLGGLAVAVSGAGWWAPVGIALAALFALAMPRTGDSAGAVAAGEGTSRDRLLDGLGRAARLGVVVFAASTFAEYLAPDSRLAVAVLFVVGVAMVDLIGVRFGLRLDAYWRRWIGGLCAAAGAAFVAVCLGVPPVATSGRSNRSRCGVCRWRPRCSCPCSSTPRGG